MKDSCLFYLQTSLVSLALVLVTTVAYAQKSSSNFYFERYTIEDGLSHRFVNDITQDSLGFLWIATNQGLNRFDGQHFEVFYPKFPDIETLAISKIQVDSLNRLWLSSNKVGDKYTQVVFDPETEESQKVEEVLEYKTPQSLKSITEFIWCNEHLYLYGNLVDSIYKFEEEGIKAIPVGRGPDEIVDELLPMGNQHLAIRLSQEGSAIERCLVLDENGNLQSEISSLPMKIIPTTYENDSLWFIGVQKKESTQAHWYKQHKDDIGRPVKITAPYQWKNIIGISKPSYTLLQEKNRPHTLYHLNNKGAVIDSLWLTNEVVVDDIREAYLNQQTLWLSDLIANPLGYLKKQPQLFDQYLHDYRQSFISSTNLQSCRGIQLYQDSILLIQTLSSGFTVNLRTGEIQDLKTSATPNVIALFWGAFLDGDTLWSGTSKQKLLEYNIKTKKKKYWEGNASEYSLESFLSTYKDKNGVLWIGASKGLWKLDREYGQVIPVQFKDTVLNNLKNAYHFYENPRGMWVCAASGLYLISENGGVRYHQNGKGRYKLPHEHISHLYEDAQGWFWLTTKGGGLLHLNPQTGVCQQFTVRDGLSHNILYAVYPDQHGYLWMSSDQGIMRFHLVNNTVDTYLERSGITHNEFNTTSHYQAPDGSIFFGSLNGVTAFHPDNFLEIQNSKASFQITSLWIREEGAWEKVRVPQKGESIIMHPQQKVLKLNLALLDYELKQPNYAYKLDGIDNSWIYLSSSSLQFNHLPYGQHKLWLKAQQSDGSWVEYPYPLQILVEKPFYLRWWFFVVLLFVAGLAFLWLLELRTSQLRKRQIELESIVAERTLQIEKDKQMISRQAEELRAMDQVKSRFFANISHELRTPLTLILGPLGYIIEGEFPLKKGQLIKSLKNIYAHAQSLLQLVEEILDLSKLDAKKLELKEEPTPISIFFNNILSSFKSEFEYKNLTFTSTIDIPSTHEYLWTDQQKIKKVLYNYLSNAIKFTPKNGSISCQIILIEDKVELLILVKDTGEGIHPKDLPHVFDRFYQSKYHEGIDRGGTGIGLALVQEFAYLMKGRAWVDSTLGKGSAFYFKYPVKTAFKKQIMPFTQKELEGLEIDKEVVISNTKNSNILVVEDNRDMRGFIAEVLSQYYEVFTAENGNEAMKFLSATSQDIQMIISDIMMPEMDGVSLLKELKNHEYYKAIPVVMLTALASEKDKLSALNLGVDDYLTKPFSVAELLVRVRNLLFNYYQRKKWIEEIEHTKKHRSELYAIDTDQKTKMANAFEKEGIRVKELEKYVLHQIKMHEEVNRELLAEKAEMSIRNLNRKLKESTGLSASQFIKEIRLRWARSCLESQTVTSISHLAYQCGYSTPETFSRHYKQLYGKLPSEYLIR